MSVESLRAGKAWRWEGQHVRMPATAEMRGLLAEMGGLSGMGRAPAPRAQEGLIDSAYKTWNEGLGFVGPNYVRAKCVLLLSVGSGVLPEELRYFLMAVQVDLEAADAIQREGVSPSDEAAHERREDESRWAVYNRFKAALPIVQKAVKRFVVKDGLDWERTRAELKRKTQNELKTNDYAVALSAFLTAMHMYLARYIAAESLQWDSA